MITNVISACLHLQLYMNVRVIRTVITKCKAYSVFSTFWNDGGSQILIETYNGLERHFRFIMKIQFCGKIIYIFITLGFHYKI